MKKYLPFIILFFFSIFITHLSFAQGNGNGNGGNGNGGNGGNNNGGNTYRIEGNQRPCVGTLETYTIKPNPGNNAVVWEWDGPRAQANEAEWQVHSISADKSQITFRVGDKPGTVRAKPVPGTNNTENLPVHPGQGLQVALTGPSAVCANVQQVYKVEIKNLSRGKKNGKDISADDLKITWVLPAGLTVVSGLNTSTLTVMPSGSFSQGTVKVTVEVPETSDGPNNNGNGVGGFTGFCGGAVNASMQVALGTNCAAVCPVTSVTIAGPATVCAEQEDLVTYAANVTNGTANMQYTWAVPSGWTINSGAGTNQIKVKVGSMPGNVTLSVKNNCSATTANASQTIAFGKDCGTPTSECPTPTVSIDGPGSVCANQTKLVKYTANVTNSSGKITYNWMVPSTWVVKSGLGTSQIEVQVGNAPGEIRVNITNDCGLQAGTVRNIMANTNCGVTPPDCNAPTVTVAGPESLCAFQDETVIFTANVTNSTSDLTYEWTIPDVIDGWEIVSNVGNTIEIRVGYAEGPVNIGVVVKNSCGEAAGSMETLVEECGEIIPQPVELLSFAGESTKTGVLLQWATAMEKDNDRFEIERSSDGQTFTKVGQVKGNGNSNSKKTYTLRDSRAGKGTFYYRLKQVDYNGDFEYSKIIPVNHSYGVTLTGMVIAPNPVSGGNFTLSLPQAATNAQVQLIDMNGRVIYTQRLEAGSYEASFSTQNLNMRPGLYLVKIQDGDQISQGRLVVK